MTHTAQHPEIPTVNIYSDPSVMNYLMKGFVTLQLARFQG